MLGKQVYMRNHDLKGLTSKQISYIHHNFFHLSSSRNSFFKEKKEERAGVVGAIIKILIMPSTKDLRFFDF